MTDETIDRLTAAINRLADGLEEVINRLDLIAAPVKEGKEKNPPAPPLKRSEKIMKALKIGLRMHQKLLAAVRENLV